MRGILMTSLVSGALTGLFYWLKEKFIRSRVPTWADGVLFGLLLGLAWLAGGWFGEVFGWTRSHMEPIAVVGGALLGGILSGNVRSIADRREPRKAPNLQPRL